MDYSIERGRIENGSYKTSLPCILAKKEEMVKKPKTIMWGVRFKGRNFPFSYHPPTIFRDLAEDQVKNLGDKFELIKLTIESVKKKG